MHWQNCEWAGGVSPVPPFVLVGMSEILPPSDPIKHDVTRLRLNQLFVGLANFVRSNLNPFRRLTVFSSPIHGSG